MELQEKYETIKRAVLRFNELVKRDEYNYLALIESSGHFWIESEVPFLKNHEVIVKEYERRTQ